MKIYTLVLINILAFVQMAAASSDLCTILWFKAGGGQPLSGAATVFKNAGYASLEHQTKLEKLVSIIKQGGLLTGDKVPIAATGIGYGANRPGRTFFFLSKNNKPPSETDVEHYSSSYSNIDGKKQGSLDCGIIVVDLEVTENARFHISSSGMRNYGAFAPGDYLSSEPLSALEHFLSQGEAGEVVLYQAVPVKNIKAIWVHPTKKAEIVNEFLSAGITSVNNIEINQFIVSP